MGTVRVRGAGHPGDPFQTILTLTEHDIQAAKAPESIVLDNPDAGYEADPTVDIDRVSTRPGWSDANRCSTLDLPEP